MCVPQPVCVCVWQYVCVYVMCMYHVSISQKKSSKMRQEEKVFMNTLIRGAMSGEETEREELGTLARAFGYGGRNRRSRTRRARATRARAARTGAGVWGWVWANERIQQPEKETAKGRKGIKSKMAGRTRDRKGSRRAETSQKSDGSERLCACMQCGVCSVQCASPYLISPHTYVLYSYIYICCSNTENCDFARYIQRGGPLTARSTRT